MTHLSTIHPVEEIVTLPLLDLPVVLVTIGVLEASAASCVRALMPPFGDHPELQLTNLLLEWKIMYELSID